MSKPTSTSPSEDDYEAFKGPGFIMERRGRFLRSMSTLTPTEHADMRRQMSESVPDIESGMAERAQALVKILHSYAPEAMISALWLRNSPLSPVTDAEAGDWGTRSHGFVEYVATLYVRDRGDGHETVVPPEIVEDVQSKVQELFTSTMWLMMARSARRRTGPEDQALEHLRFTTNMNGLFVRYPGFHQHLEVVLEGIDAELHHDLREPLGWNLQDAVRLAHAAVELFDDRLNAAADTARHTLQENVPDDLDEVERLRWQYGIAWWLQTEIQSVATFTPAELADRAQIDVDRARAFLSSATSPWGSCAEDRYLLPHSTPPIGRRPVLDVGDGRYFLPLPQGLLWAVRPLVEDLLKPDGSDEGRTWWQRYEEARSKFAEAHAVSLLAKVLPHAGAFHSLAYPWVKDGQPVQAELDGLLIADDLAVLVEVKAGEMSQPGRRGAPSMAEDLRKLIGDPHEQALRARAYMQSTDEVDFSLDARRGVRIHSGQLSDFIMVTVTLDALDVFTATLYRLTDLGVIGGRDLPWAVSLLDLAVIAEAIEFPAQFIHFLRRRTRLNELAFVMAHDELDWFGQYLSEGLYFEHLLAPPDSDEAQPLFNYFGYSDALEPHFLWDERSGEERPPLPRQAMPDGMRSLLLELEEAQHQGYLTISSALLDLSSDARGRLFAGIAEATDRTREDGGHHEFALAPEYAGGRGYTFVASADRDELQQVLHGYSRLKMYQTRASEWLGVGRLVPSGNLLDEAAFFRQPWEYDEELERVCAEYLEPLPSSPADHHDRGA